MPIDPVDVFLRSLAFELREFSADATRLALRIDDYVADLKAEAGSATIAAPRSPDEESPRERALRSEDPDEEVPIEPERTSDEGRPAT